MHPYLWIASALPTEIVLPFLLRNADIVLVQHDLQRTELLKKNINAFIFRNIIDIDPIYSKVSAADREGYIYVGSLDVRKGFREFVHVVESIKDKKFNVIGQAREETVLKDLFKQLEHLPNVRLFGRLSQKETVRHIATSEALISTSPYEGFRTLFFWKLGVWAHLLFRSL